MELHVKAGNCAEAIARQGLIPIDVTQRRPAGLAVRVDQLLARYRCDRLPSRIPSSAIGHHQQPANVQSLRTD